jgi:hypothetical protein
MVVPTRLAARAVRNVDGGLPAGGTSRMETLGGADTLADDPRLAQRATELRAR